MGPLLRDARDAQDRHTHDIRWPFHHQLFRRPHGPPAKYFKQKLMNSFRLSSPKCVRRDCSSKQQQEQQHSCAVKRRSVGQHTKGLAPAAGFRAGQRLW